MRRLTRGVIAAVLILIVLAVIAGGYLWYSMGQPLYRPGMVRAGKNLRALLTPPAQPADEQFWKVEEDIQLHHFAAGAGRNVLVIHGGPGYPYLKPWAGLEPLTQSYQFHYYDQRGSGQSTRPIDTFTSQNYYENLTTLDKTLGLGAQIADIERIRQILGEEKLILVGHSFGGFLASLYAAEFPEHVEALILVAPADVLLMPAEDSGLFTLVRERLPEDMRPAYDDWQKRYFDYGTIFSKSEAELAALNDEFKPFYYAVAPGSFPEQGETGGWGVHAIYFSMGQRHDYRAAMKNVTAPVLVIHGADDLQPEAASRRFAEAFSNVRFEVIENAAHFSFEEQPEAFGAVVGEFLDSLR